MQWRIIGAEIQTGKDVNCTTDAPDRQTVESWARAMGILWSDITLDIPYAEKSSPPLRQRRVSRTSLIIWTPVAIIAGLLALRIFTAPAVTPPPVGSIHGAAWASRKTGSSDLLRGLNIDLLGLKVPTSAVYPKIATQLRRIKKNVDFQEVGEYSQQIHATEIAADKLLIDKGERFIAGAAQEVDYADAFIAINQLLPKAEPIAVGTLNAPIVATASTDVQGCYSFSGVRPGLYYLHAQLVTEYSCIEWVIPVRVSGGTDQKFDLYNDTAARIVNRD